MTRTEILEAIVKKQDELIKVYEQYIIAYETEGFDYLNDLQLPANKLINKLSDLAKQLEECEGKEKILIDFANKLTKDFNEDKSDQSQIGFSTDLDVNDLY